MKKARYGTVSKRLCGLFRRTASRTAFSLAETVVALLVLSIALLAIATVPVMSTKLALHTVQRERAMTIAVRSLDALESLRFDVAVNSADVAGDFTVVSEKPIFDQASPETYIGKVSVTWTGIGGRSALLLERRLSKFSDATR